MSKKFNIAVSKTTNVETGVAYVNIAVPESVGEALASVLGDLTPTEDGISDLYDALACAGLDKDVNAFRDFVKDVGGCGCGQDHGSAP